MYCGMGILPVPIVRVAGGLFGPPHKKFDVLWLRAGSSAHPTRNLMYCGTGILPVPIVREGGHRLCRRGLNRRVSLEMTINFNYSNKSLFLPVAA